MREEEAICLLRASGCRLAVASLPVGAVQPGAVGLDSPATARIAVLVRNTSMSFASLGLIDPLLRNLQDLNYQAPRRCRPRRFLPCSVART